MARSNNKKKLKDPTTPDVSGFMIQCDSCDEWYYGSPLGISEQEAEDMDDWFCVECIRKRNDELSKSNTHLSSQIHKIELEKQALLIDIYNCKKVILEQRVKDLEVLQEEKECLETQSTLADLRNQITLLQMNCKQLQIENEALAIKEKQGLSQKEALLADLKNKNVLLKMNSNQVEKENEALALKVQQELTQKEALQNELNEKISHLTEKLRMTEEALKEEQKISEALKNKYLEKKEQLNKEKAHKTVIPKVTEEQTENESFKAATQQRKQEDRKTVIANHENCHLKNKKSRLSLSQKGSTSQTKIIKIKKCYIDDE